MWEMFQKTVKSVSQLPFWLLCTVVLVVSRMATWFFPFDSDHWIFYYVGRRWAEGASLYVDMWDHKSPLIFGFNAILYKIFGDNIFWHRLVLTLIAIVTIWVFYKTARLLLEQIGSKNSLQYAKIGTLFFIFFANLSQFTNSANNNENLAMLPLLGSLYFYLKWRQTTNQKWYILVISGLLAGIVFTLKANFAILLLPIAFDIIYLQHKKLLAAVANLAIFGIAALAQLLIWVAYFVHLGTIKQFYIATFEFNSKYIKALGWDLGSPGVAVFLLILGLLIVFFAPFVIYAISRTKQIISKDHAYELIVPLLALSVIVFIALAGTFYSHYFLIIIPYLCLVLAATINNVQKLKFIKVLYISWAIIAVFMLLISYKQLYNNFRGTAANELAKQQQVADYIKSRTEPSDTIFANIYGATMYRLADRNSGTRFISASHLLIDYKNNFGYDFNSIAIGDLEKSKPKYIIISADPDDLYITKNPVMTKYFSEHYKFEATVGGHQIIVRK